MEHNQLQSVRIFGGIELNPGSSSPFFPDFERIRFTQEIRVLISGTISTMVIGVAFLLTLGMKPYLTGPILDIGMYVTFDDGLNTNYGGHKHTIAINWNSFN